LRRQTAQGMGLAAMPEIVWTLLADPANRPMLALTLAGLVVIVFGPWAIVKIAQRCGGRRLTAYDPSFETKMVKSEEIARRYRDTLRKLAK